MGAADIGNDDLHQERRSGEVIRPPLSERAAAGKGVRGNGKSLREIKALPS
jgi:hypothetical protein